MTVALLFGTSNTSAFILHTDDHLASLVASHLLGQEVS